MKQKHTEHGETNREQDAAKLAKPEAKPDWANSVSSVSK